MVRGNGHSSVPPPPFFFPSKTSGNLNAYRLQCLFPPPSLHPNAQTYHFLNFATSHQGPGIADFHALSRPTGSFPAVFLFSRVFLQRELRTSLGRPVISPSQRRRVQPTTSLTTANLSSRRYYPSVVQKQESVILFPLPRLFRGGKAPIVSVAIRLNVALPAYTSPLLQHAHWDASTALVPFQILQRSLDGPSHRILHAARPLLPEPRFETLLFLRKVYDHHSYRISRFRCASPTFIHVTGRASSLAPIPVHTARPCATSFYRSSCVPSLIVSLSFSPTLPPSRTS